MTVDVSEVAERREHLGQREAVLEARFFDERTTEHHDDGRDLVQQHFTELCGSRIHHPLPLGWRPRVRISIRFDLADRILTAQCQIESRGLKKISMEWMQNV